jgi:hypothetical protein
MEVQLFYAERRRTDWEKDRHEKADCRFPQLCERVKKWIAQFFRSAIVWCLIKQETRLVETGNTTS